MSEFDRFGLPPPEEIDKFADRAEEMMKGLGKARERFDEITGEGEGSDGKVRAVTDANGVLKEIVFHPKSMRMASETLSEATTEAIRNAQDDAEKKGREMLGGTLGEDMFADEDAGNPMARLQQALRVFGGTGKPSPGGPKDAT